jgi:hypothetical protein
MLTLQAVNEINPETMLDIAPQCAQRMPAPFMLSRPIE